MITMVSTTIKFSQEVYFGQDHVAFFFFLSKEITHQQPWQTIKSHQLTAVQIDITHNYSQVFEKKVFVCDFKLRN